MPTENGCVCRQPLVLDRALRHRALFDFGDGCPGASIQQEELAALGRLDQRGNDAAVCLRQVYERRLRRQIVVPDVVMHGLETPAHRAVGDVERHDRAGIFFGRVRAMRAEEVGRAVAGRRVDEPERVVVAHQGPDVRRAARVLLACGRFGVDAGPAHVPRPRELAGDQVVGADDAGRLVDLEVVRDARADDCEIACDQRRRRDEIDVRLRFADAFQQIRLRRSSPKPGAALARRCVQRHEPRVGRAHDDARGAIAAVALGCTVITHAAAGAVEADGRDLHLRVEFPALRAGLGIERDHDVHRRAHVQQVADLQRRCFELPGAAGAVVPDFFQAADVRCVDLIEARVARAVRRVAVVMPLTRFCF